MNSSSDNSRSKTHSLYGWKTGVIGAQVSLIFLSEIGIAHPFATNQDRWVWLIGIVIWLTLASIVLTVHELYRVLRGKSDGLAVMLVLLATTAFGTTYWLWRGTALFFDALS